MIYRSRITSILLAILIAANQLIAFAGQNQKEASGQEESVKLKAVLIDAAMTEPLPHRQLDLSASAEFLERPADDAQVTLRIWR